MWSCEKSDSTASFTTECSAEERTKSLERPFGVTSLRGLSGTEADVAEVSHPALDDHVMTAGLGDGNVGVSYVSFVQLEAVSMESGSQEVCEQVDEEPGEDTSVSTGGNARTTFGLDRIQERIRQVLNAAYVMNDSHRRQSVPATTIGGTGGTPVIVPDPWCADTRSWMRSDTGSSQRDGNHLQRLEDDGVSDYSESDLSQDYGADYGEQWFEDVTSVSATQSPVVTPRHHSGYIAPSMAAASSHEPMASSMHVQGGDDGRSASERRVPIPSPYEVITLAPQEAASVLANGQLRTIVWTFLWRQSRLVHSVVDQPAYWMDIFAARQMTWWQMWTDYLVQRAASPPDDPDHQPLISQQWLAIYDRMQESAHVSHFGIRRADIPPPPPDDPWHG